MKIVDDLFGKLGPDCQAFVDATDTEPNELLYHPDDRVRIIQEFQKSNEPSRATMKDAEYFATCPVFNMYLRLMNRRIAAVSNTTCQPGTVELWLNDGQDYGDWPGYRRFPGPISEGFGPDVE